MLDHLVATEHVTLGVGDGLAVLDADHPGDVFLVLLEELLVLEHVPHLLWDWNLLPLMEGVLRILNDGVEFALGRLRHLCDDFSSVHGITDIVSSRSLRRYPLAVNAVRIYLEAELSSRSESVS